MAEMRVEDSSEEIYTLRSDAVDVLKPVNTLSAFPYTDYVTFMDFDSYGRSDELEERIPLRQSRTNLVEIYLSK
ncbi:hypothetical protein DPMN_053324 [Dreissena polymorpha]|uniref:Uncharacterized protein n=1 Tax=Dreissena polymorpha TaxID=45954 RepID=A0A9D4HQL5_DREPO|nr:hypothetical protein DPMN_053324 [Dreissena polymorpha]